MSDKAPKLPKIDELERTPLVTQLIEIVQYQTEIIQVLRDDIVVLKGNKPKPPWKNCGAVCVYLPISKRTESHPARKRRSNSASVLMRSLLKKLIISP